jgi:hypothetical protein
MSQPQELFDEPGTALATVPQTGPITPLGLIQSALSKNVAPEVLKELVALQQSMVRFEWEAQERQSKIDFDDALNACQQQIGRIAPNQNRQDTRSWWADYSQLDRTIRPIYTAARFSISFSEVAPLSPIKVRIQATLSRAGVSREYYSEITPSTTGPKGGAMATATDADAIAASRAKRYLLLSIFNLAIGIDSEEQKGNIQQGECLPEGTVQEYVDALKEAPDLPSLKTLFSECYTKAKKLEDSMAKKAFQDTYEAAKRRFLNANSQ